MLNFDEREEAKMEQEAFEASFADKVQETQIIYMTDTEFARAAQHRALLMALRSAVDGDGYDLEKVARHVVATFNELEGAGC